MRLLAALALGLRILDTALYLNQLIREPGKILARRPSHIGPIFNLSSGPMSMSSSRVIDLIIYTPPDDRMENKLSRHHSIEGKEHIMVIIIRKGLYSLGST